MYYQCLPEVLKPDFRWNHIELTQTDLSTVAKIFVWISRMRMRTYSESTNIIFASLFSFYNLHFLERITSSCWTFMLWSFFIFLVVFFLPFDKNESSKWTSKKRLILPMNMRLRMRMRMQACVFIYSVHGECFHNLLYLFIYVQ